MGADHHFVLSAIISICHRGKNEDVGVFGATILEQFRREKCGGFRGYHFRIQGGMRTDFHGRKMKRLLRKEDVATVKDGRCSGCQGRKM